MYHLVSSIMGYVMPQAEQNNPWSIPCSKDHSSYTVYHSISQYTAVHHSIPQYTAVYCSTSQYTTVYHSIPQYIAVYHSITVYHSIPQRTLVQYTTENRAVISSISQNEYILHYLQFSSWNSWHIAVSVLWTKGSTRMEMLPCWLKVSLHGDDKQTKYCTSCVDECGSLIGQTLVITVY